MREVVMSKKGYYVAECKPTTPDVEVDIYAVCINALKRNTITRSTLYIKCRIRFFKQKQF